MKKFTLFASMAVLALGANAQDFVTTDVYVEPTASKGQIFDVIFMEENAVDELVKAGKTVNAVGPDEQSRFLYYWENTIVNGPTSPLGVGWDSLVDPDNVSLSVAPDKTWSGAGLSVNATVGLNFNHITPETRFHMAYCTAGKAPQSTVISIFDLDKAVVGAVSPAGKFCLGTSALDATAPALGPTPTSEWQAVDISLGDLKKLYSGFNIDIQKRGFWFGNLWTTLQGAVAGDNVCYDATYFYTPGESGVAGVADDEATFIFTGKTLNVAGGNGIKLYDLGGRTVMSTEGTTLGTDNLPQGVYVAVSGNSVKKVVVK